MKPRILLVFLPMVTAVAAQTSFEVASIKPAAAMPMGKMMIGMNADAGMLRYTNVSLKDCIRTAYRVKDFQVQGPDWIDNERFDITAKLPPGASQDQIPEMLQALLADRFKLTLTRDRKDQSVYALVAGKGGPKLKPAEIAVGDRPSEGGKPPTGDRPRGAMSMQMGPGGAHLKAPSTSLANLAELLSRFSERPVVDMTGIQGQYEFDLTFTPETMRMMPGGPPGGPDGHGGGPPPAATDTPTNAPTERSASLFDSVQQYGLRLEPRKAPMEMLTVTHIEKAPTDN